MNREIAIELQFFLISVLWGAIILFAYDQLRILRRVIRHNNFFVTVQDISFWIFASVFIFAMLYVKNSGTIRGFSVMGMVIGMITYHYLLSDRIVTLISRGILLLMRPVSLAIRYIRKAIGFIINRLSKLINRIYRQLKLKAKSVKMFLKSRKKSISKEDIKNI
ncbi:MAG: hypothetical protein GX379_09875 [Clostridiales bacterium]|jgi:spore cortex biosynthesis protein YabQ|nr:hypothetical protein [Clostridiales bacterium]